MTKRILTLAAAVALSFALSGCALLGLFGEKTGQDAVRATQIVLTAYADIYQPALILYGSYKTCGTPEAEGKIVCKDGPTFQKLKALDLAATSAIVAARDVLRGTVPDAGQLQQAIAAITQAQAAIAAAPNVKIKVPEALVSFRVEPDALIARVVYGSAALSERG